MLRLQWRHHHPGSERSRHAEYRCTTDDDTSCASVGSVHAVSATTGATSRCRSSGDASPSRRIGTGDSDRHAAIAYRRNARIPYAAGPARVHTAASTEWRRSISAAFRTSSRRASPRCADATGTAHAAAVHTAAIHTAALESAPSSCSASKAACRAGDTNDATQRLTRCRRRRRSAPA